MFFILNDVDIASYVDDNTPYVIANDINGVIAFLEKASRALFLNGLKKICLKVIPENVIYK